MNARTFFQTVRHLKLTQIYYQLRYRLLPAKQLPFLPESIVIPGMEDFHFPPRMAISPVSEMISACFEKTGAVYKFRFIGLTEQFKDHIDWNYSESGKLWTYNLNYFDFLSSAACGKDTGLSLIQDYLAKFSSLKDGLEPYPTSLRIINWIKFLVRHKIGHALIDKALYWQCKLLSARLEYHLMGNHLLENGFALVSGGCYLQEAGYYNTGKYIVLKELDEQILQDGGHFEQSPMYHQIILHRLLDVINLLNSCKTIPGQDAFEEKLKGYASRMLGWMSNMTFSNGEFPCFNDAAKGIAPDAAQLQTYAGELEIQAKTVPLKESGYKMWRKQGIELCFDAGNVAARYQPGHTHADTFSFCLHVNSRPIIVDTGISTYEKNSRRQIERSTSAHNTVNIEERDSSAVWGAFRLGRRAHATITDESTFRMTAHHNGYLTMGCVHQRTFDWQERCLVVEDLITGHADKPEGISRLHFHPDCKVALENNLIRVNDRLKIEAQGFTTLFIETYQFCNGFNDLVTASRVTGRFSSKVSWKISIF